MKEVFAAERDEDECKGSVKLVEEAWGYSLFVNGRQVLFVDLFRPATNGGFPELFIEEGPDQEPLAKLVIPDDRREPVVLVVHKDADRQAGPTPLGIHHSGDDVYIGEPMWTIDRISHEGVRAVGPKRPPEVEHLG